MKFLILSIIILAVTLSPVSGSLIISVSAQETVTICHRPPDNPENVQTITVGKNAVPAHLAHGDTLGECTTPPTDTATVTVTKVVNGGPHSPEQFTLCVNTSDESSGIPSHFTPATPPCAPGSGSGFTYTVKPGFLFINEILPPDAPTSYQGTLECQPATLEVTAGETRTCTWTNTFTGPS